MADAKLREMAAQLHTRLETVPPHDAIRILGPMVLELMHEIANLKQMASALERRVIEIEKAN